MVIAIVVLILIVRAFYVPKDFGAHARGYTYGFHRLGNEQDWKDFPAKYKNTSYCNECHEEKVNSLAKSKHGVIPCEDCHGPALNHPEDPEKLPVDRSRDLCIRCHAQLVMISSGRSAIPGIDPATHNPDTACSECHNPHDPNLEDM